MLYKPYNNIYPFPPDLIGLVRFIPILSALFPLASYLPSGLYEHPNNLDIIWYKLTS